MTPSLNSVISPVVKGDDISITRTITAIPDAVTLSEAWLTIKTNIGDADPGLIQKIIITADVPGTGQITDAGTGTAPNRTATLRFDLTDIDTALPTPGTLYHFDVQVRTNGNAIYTAERGLISTIDQVTEDI